MELILQRWTWAATLGAAIFSAFFAARAVNTLVASALAPTPGIAAGASSGPRSSAAVRSTLDGDRFASAFGLPAPKPLVDAAAATASAAQEAAGPRASWSDEPVRSPLHGLLVGTAIASPDRWSLCQLTNTDANETLVYAVGDTFLDARIYKIEKARVLIDHQGKNEFIDATPPGAPNLGATATAANGVKQLSENQYSISKKEIDGALANLSDLATKTRIVPSFNSPDKALEIYQKRRDSTRIDIELERRGETIRKQYSIDP